MNQYFYLILEKAAAESDVESDLSFKLLRKPDGPITVLGAAALK
jgi:hypothetical protein